LNIRIADIQACYELWKSRGAEFITEPKKKYGPEVLYALFFIWPLCSGPGRFSVDYWLAGKLRT
jgi:hypothetical protein